MNKRFMTAAITALLLIASPAQEAEGPLAIWGGGAQGDSV